MFPAISDAKFKEGIFDGPQIRPLFNDANFVVKMSDMERAAWVSFKNISQNFLGNSKSENSKTLIGLLDESQITLPAFSSGPLS